MVKNPPANAGDACWIPGSGRSPRGGHGNLLQYPCLENPMDRGAWQATVHRVAKSWTRLKRLSMHTLPYIPDYLLWAGNMAASALKSREVSIPWLGLCISTAGGPSSIPEWGTKIPNAIQHSPPPPKNKSQEGRAASPNSIYLFLERAMIDPF